MFERFEKEQTLDYFSERDLIELLLELSRCPGDRRQIAESLLDTFGSIKTILEARPEQLIKVEGIGERTASIFHMEMLLIRAWERIGMPNPKKIGNSVEAETYCKSLLIGSRLEQFYVICLNAKCHILGKRKISDGSLSEVNAYPRIVTETALNYNAHSILLTHNHPGGTNSPSNEDIQTTITLQRTLTALGIIVLDHVIVSGNNAYSMIQHGDIFYKTR